MNHIQVNFKYLYFVRYQLFGFIINFAQSDTETQLGQGQFLVSFDG